MAECLQGSMHIEQEMRGLSASYLLLFLFSARTHSFAAVRWMLNQLPEPDMALKLSTKGLKAFFDLSMARDLIAASARYDVVFDEQIFKMA